MPATVLAVDDDKNLLKVVEFNLVEEGYEVLKARSGEEALDLLEANQVDLVITDIRMPGMGGMELLERIKENWPDTGVILLTAFAAIDSAVEAIRAGAVDYIPKPFNQDDLKFRVERALQQSRMKKENVRLKNELSRRDGFEGLVGKSPEMREVFELIGQVASSDSTVLITGGSGTGKELAARAIHRLGDRCDQPWIAINCAAIPRELLESDLFGHVKGAFTGAIRDQAGKFELADGGTIFLDEVGDIDLALQPKLLRVLQEREIQRVGGTTTRKVDVRIITATQTDLKKLVERGKFREDLYYRLNVIPIHLPPLKERKGDTVLLADHFLEKFSKGQVNWSKQALELLEKYDWPGNVRELENLVERMVVLKKGHGGIIGPEDLPPEIRSGPDEKTDRLEGKTLRQAEKEMIVRALEKAGGNRSQAARDLGIERHVLLYRLKKYGID